MPLWREVGFDEQLLFPPSISVESVGLPSCQDLSWGIRVMFRDLSNLTGFEASNRSGILCAPLGTEYADTHQDL